MARPVIPETLDQLSPAWLTAQLRSQGLLDEGRVVGFQAEILGEGAGFVGEVARLHLELEDAAAPRSLIAKLPTAVGENRRTAEFLLGLYEREIQFYRELAPHVPIRTPRLLGADLDPNPASEQGPAVIAWLDRRPLWLRRLLMAFFRWLAGRSRRRYVLLLEDLAPGRAGDQVAGLDAEACASILRALAHSQAALWESPLLDGYFWLSRPDLGARIFHQQFQLFRAAFEARFGAWLDTSARESLDWLEAHGAELLRALHGDAPETLIHGDFRLDNLIFDTPESAIALDWQAVCRGAGVFDVAYFLSGALHTRVSTETERALVRVYHEALVEAGVASYSLEACQRDYERSMIAMLQQLVASDAMDLGTARGATLLERWVARTLRRLRDVDVKAALLAPSPTPAATDASHESG